MNDWNRVSYFVQFSLQPKIQSQVTKNSLLKSLDPIPTRIEWVQDHSAGNLEEEKSFKRWSPAQKLFNYVNYFNPHQKHICEGYSGITQRFLMKSTHLYKNNIFQENLTRIPKNRRWWLFRSKVYSTADGVIRGSHKVFGFFLWNKIHRLSSTVNEFLPEEFEYSNPKDLWNKWSHLLQSHCSRRNHIERLHKSINFRIFEIINLRNIGLSKTWM